MDAIKLIWFESKKTNYKLSIYHHFSVAHSILFYANE